MPDALSPRAARLLEAHVAHELGALRGPAFEQLVRSEVDTALRAAGSLTLDQVMTRDRVRDVAVKYVATFRLPGAIPEIAGDIATRVRSHPANQVPLGELVSRATVDELVSVLTEMRALRERVLRGLVDSSSLQAGVGGLVHGLATGAVGAGVRLARRVPGVDAGATVAGRAAAGVVETRVGGAVVPRVGGLVDGVVSGVDQRTREVAEQAARRLLAYLGSSAAESVSDDELRAAVLEVWDALATRPLRELLVEISDHQVVELFVAIYQLWLDLRVSDYITTLVEAGVDAFFETYGEFTLDRLLEEFGLDGEDLVEEALRFGPPVIESLVEEGYLEALLRRRLASFYASPVAREVLDG